MSEQSPLQSSVGVFVEWAKARLDEMAASAKVLESRLDSLDVNVRAQAEQAIAHVKQWIAESQAQIKDVQAKGAASIAEAKAQIEATWSKFQSESGKWAELAKDQQATFQARAQAQAQAWQNVVNSYMQRAAELHAQTRRRLRRMSRSSRPMLRRPRPISKLRSMILARPVRHHGPP